MKFLLSIIFAFTLEFSYSQSFSYQNIPEKISNLDKVTELEIEEIKRTIFKNGIHMTTYLPYKPDRKGKIDYTKFIQQGINQNNIIIMPDFPVLINHSGLKLKSNSKILFQKNSQLIMMPNDKESYSALNIEDVTGVKVFFANLKGDRTDHLTNIGEWGMGIFIRHSKDVHIYKPRIIDFWGDGIYIGKGMGLPSSNIKVFGGIIDNNRRNGISIISANGVTISNTIISNTNGTSPEYGLDIEPNKPEDGVNNVLIENVISFNNKNGGILFAFDYLQGKKNLPVNVIVRNFTDFYSKNGIGFYFDRGYNKFISPLRGNILLDSIRFVDTLTPMETADSKASMINVTLNKFIVNNGKISIKELSDFVKKVQLGKNALIK